MNGPSSATERAAQRASFIRLTDGALDRLRDGEAAGGLSTALALAWVAKLSRDERLFLLGVAVQAVNRDDLAEMQRILGRLCHG